MFKMLRSWAATSLKAIANDRVPDGDRVPSEFKQLASPEDAEAALKLYRAALRPLKPDKALQLLQSAIDLDPQLADAQFLLGNLFREQGQLQDAEHHYGQALLANPMHAEAHCNLGGLLKDFGRLEEAAREFESALEVKPTLAPASFNLAMLMLGQDRWEEAIGLLHSTLKNNPKQPDAHYWLGNALMRQGDVSGARAAYKLAVAESSNFERARWGYAMAQLPAVTQTPGEQQEAAPNFVRELKKFKSWMGAHRPPQAHLAVGAQQPYYLAYLPENNTYALREYGALCSQLMLGWSSKVGLPQPRPASGGKCKLGIVSAHLCSHSVWHAIIRGWVQHMDPARFELHLFHTGQTRDAETEWAARHAKTFHYRLGDWAAWAKAVSDSQLDVLIYPEIGMDSTSVKLSALRLARTQLAAWGHPITTGLPTIDGFVSAAAFEPSNAAQHYTEQLFALPHLGCSYKSFGVKASRVDLAAWGVQPQDRVLICAGTPFKYAPADDATLIDVARRCAPCKILFFMGKPEPLALLLQARLRRAFMAAQVDFDDCARFIPWLSQADFFGVLDRADVYLDSIGFSGFNTAMQAIEMATPVVAWDGEFMRGRFASGILREAGLGEWVASSRENYVEKIAQICTDKDTRDQYKRQIVSQRGVLFDDRKAVDSLGALLLKLS